MLLLYGQRIDTHLTLISYVYADAQDAGHISGRQECVRRTSNVRQDAYIICTSLVLSVFAHSFTLLPFSNSVLSKLGNWAKLTINTFTGMYPAVFLHILKYIGIAT